MRLTGSRPVNGSSISSTSGSWRTAAMNWTFCWLPLDSSSARRSAYSGIRKRRSQPAPPGAPDRAARRTATRSRRAGRAPSSARRARALRAGSPRSGAAVRRTACRPTRSRRRRPGRCRDRSASWSSCRRRSRRGTRRPRRCPTSKVSRSRAASPRTACDLIDGQAHRRRIAADLSATHVRPVTVRTVSATNARDERDDPRRWPTPECRVGSPGTPRRGRDVRDRRLDRDDRHARRAGGTSWPRRWTGVAEAPVRIRPDGLGADEVV